MDLTQEEETLLKNAIQGMFGAKGVNGSLDKTSFN